jgi:hypothetical protein
MLTIRVRRLLRREARLLRRLRLSKLRSMLFSSL